MKNWPSPKKKKEGKNEKKEQKLKNIVIFSFHSPFFLENKKKEHFYLLTQKSLRFQPYHFFMTLGFNF